MCCILVASHVDVRDAGSWVTGIGDSGGFGGPVTIFLQLQSQMHIQRPWWLVSPTEQPGEGRRSPAVIGHLNE